jgi:hypothetical protein
MGLGRMTSNLFTHSNLHPTNPKLVSIILPHLWCYDKPWAILDSQDSPWPGIGGSHHLPPYIIFCAFSWSPHPNDLLVLGLPKGSLETTKVGLLQLYGVITSCSDLRSRWDLKQSCSSCWEFFNNVSHSICTHESRVNSRLFCGWESNCQFDSRPFFLP